MRIVVADDHPLYREAASTQIKRLFPDAQVDEVGAIEELRALINQPDAKFELFLVDFHMPGMSAATITELVGLCPTTPIAVISGTAHLSDIRSVLECGARGFIPKTATAEYLEHAMRLLLSGGTSVPRQVLLGEEFNADASPPMVAPDWIALLTQREREVLKRVAKGMSNKEIGRELKLAEVTIKLHLRSVFRKIGARSRSDAAVMAVKAGLA
jgi:two-component system, NarL family, nitrate/nitrite response regulator NarL